MFVELPAEVETFGSAQTFGDVAKSHESCRVLLVELQSKVETFGSAKHSEML